MSGLTPEQDAAVRRSGQDVCVLAGPGSGKTRVLTERFSWLVIEKDVSPRNILALTFTEKAASEIKERVAKTLRERCPDRQNEIELAPISTFHGLCARILQEFSIAAGLDPATELWDERLARAELYASAEEVLDEAARTEKAALRKLLTTWNSNELAADLCGLYDRVLSLGDEFPKAGEAIDVPRLIEATIAAAEDVLAAPAVKPASVEFRAKFVGWVAQLRALPRTPSWQHVTLFDKMPPRTNLSKELQTAAKQFYEGIGDVCAYVVSALVHEERGYLIEILRRMSGVYTARKRAAARMDFHDLEHLTIRLLRERADIREELRRRFEHILMDEMQDTNPVQWTLLNLLRTPGAFFAVGDINQSIYGFRFAAPELFNDYSKTIGGEIDELRDNFRSREEILEFTGRVFDDIPKAACGRSFDTANVPVSLHGFERAPEEYRWIAQEIQRLEESFVVEPKNGSGLRRLRLSDIAILVRTTNIAEAIAAVLAEAGIPYTLGGGRRFFETQEVSDLINYLEVLANPENTISLAAVLRSPFVGLTDDQLLDNFVEPKFAARLEGQRKRMDAVSPDRLLMEALDASGYRKTLSSAGRANVSKFLRLAREEWRREPKNMRAFADEMQRMRRAKSEKSAPVADSGNALQILTAHSSKGLEFPVVFVAAACYHDSNRKPSLCFHATHGVGVRWVNPITGATVADRWAMKIEEANKQQERDETRRLLYVALTRAEQRLYVTWGGTEKRGWMKYLAAHRDVVYDAGPELAYALEDTVATGAETVTGLRGLPAQPVVLSSTTPTDIAKYALCPRRYFLDRLAGLAVWPASSAGEFQEAGEESEKVRAPDLGSAVHRILAGEVPDADYELARELAGVFEKSDLARRMTNARWVEREFDVVFAIEDLVVQGQIDLCFEEEDGTIVIVDYKTDAVRNESEARERTREYASQLALYRHAIENLYPAREVKGHLHFLRIDLVTEPDPVLDIPMLRRFREMATFETKPGRHCDRCPHFAQACPVSKKVE